MGLVTLNFGLFQQPLVYGPYGDGFSLGENVFLAVIRQDKSFL
jgi:hypothetical protein